MKQKLSCEEFKKKYPLLYWGDYQYMKRREKENLRTLPLLKNDLTDASCIAEAFTWDETPQGHEYWMKICDRIEEQFRDF